MAIRQPREGVVLPKSAQRPALRLVEAPPPAAPATGLYFHETPRAGRNDVTWTGPTTAFGEVTKLLQRATGYRVDVIERLSYGGWLPARPGEAGTDGLVDADDRLVVELRDHDGFVRRGPLA